MDITVMTTLTVTSQMTSNGFHPLSSSLIMSLNFCMMNWSLFRCNAFGYHFYRLEPIRDGEHGEGVEHALKLVETTFLAGFFVHLF